jgi:hypothetical protein
MLKVQPAHSPAQANSEPARISAADLAAHKEVDDARVGVERLRLIVGLWRARDAADALGERAICHNLEMLIVLANDLLLDEEVEAA